MSFIGHLIAAGRSDPRSVFHRPASAVAPGKSLAGGLPSMKRLPVQSSPAAERRSASAEAAYQREQAAKTATAIKIAKQCVAERAQQVREDAVPASTRFAHAVLANAARARGEKFDPSQVIAGPPQRQVKVTAEQIIAAGRRRRGEA